LIFLKVEDNYSNLFCFKIELQKSSKSSTLLRDTIYYKPLQQYVLIMKSQLTFLFVVLFTGSVFAQLTLKKVTESELYQTPPFKQCHASTLVQLSDGTFLAAAFGGTQEGNTDVSIWLSRYEKGKWQAPEKVATGASADGKVYPNWNPVLYKITPETLTLFYKTGPSPREWWGMYKVSTDEGKTWGPAQRLPDGILGPIKNKPITLVNGTLLAPSSTETRTTDGLSWKAHIEKSVDGGKHWEKIPIDPNTPYDVIQPSILVHTQDTLQILCRSRNDALMQAFSYDGGNTWSAITKTRLPNPNSGTDALTLSNGKHLLVYNPLINGKNDRSKLHIAYSEDGIVWEDVYVLESHKRGEYSYPAIIQDSENKIHVTYTYERKNIKHLTFNIL